MLDQNRDATLLDRLSPREIAGHVWVGWRLVAAVMLAVTLLTGVFALLREPVFRAQTQLLVFNAKLGLGRDDAVFAESQVDTLFLETQIELIRSDKIALDVAKLLALPPARGSSTVRAPSGPDAEAALAPLRAVQADRLRRGLMVERVGASSMVTIAYAANDRDFAARLANAFASAYVQDLETSRNDAAQSASAWLRDRIKDLGPRARIISAATPPLFATGPSKLVLLVLGMLAGLVLGVTAAIARGLLDTRMRTPEQAVAVTGAECLGVIPLAFGDGGVMRSAGVHASSRLGTELVSEDEGLRATLRRVVIALEQSQPEVRPLRLGITSAVEGEGTTTIALAFARLLSEQGRRVLLVDSDPVNADLSSPGQPGQRGLIEALQSGGGNLDTMRDDRSAVQVLRIGGGRLRARRAHLIWSEAMDRLLEQQREAYDVVVFDMPALTASADVRAAADRLPAVLLVVGYRAVTEQALRIGLEAAGQLGEKLIGTVINAADTAELRQLGSPAWQYFAQRPAAGAREPAATSPAGDPRPAAAE